MNETSGSPPGLADNKGSLSMRNLIVGLVLALVLAACQTPTSYKPHDGRYGYAEEQLDETTYRVLFSGNEHTSRETVNDHLMRRAAELTIELGFERFVIIRSVTEKVPPREANEQVTCGYGYYYGTYFYYPDIIPSHYVGVVYIKMIAAETSYPPERQIPAKEVLNWLAGCPGV